MKRLVIFFCLLLLIACNKLSKGTVIKKQFQPAYSWVSMQPIHIGKTTTYMPVTHYVSEKYVLTIRGTYKGEMREEEVYVSPGTFEHTAINEMYVVKSDDSNNW